MKRCMALILSLLMLFACVVTASAETELSIIMNLEELDDGSVNVTLTDSEGGTVLNWPVTLTVDGEEQLTLNTDLDGEALFDVDISEDAEEVAFSAIDGEVGEYFLKGCTMYLERTIDSTEDEQDGEQTETEESDVEGEPTTTPSGTQIPQGGYVNNEDSLSISPRTTAVNEKLVGIGIDVDNGVLNASQNAAVDYSTSARMWMDAEQYASLVSDAQATLHLQLSMNAEAGAKSVLVNAKNADPKYASYADANVKGYAMDLSLVYIGDTGRVQLDVPDGIYTVELPVPVSMQSCEKIAIAACTESGLNPFMEVKPSGGVLSFTVQRLQTLAIVGFGEQGQALGSLAQTPTLIVVMIAVGVVLVIAAILLFVFVVFRRKREEKKAADPTENREAAHLLIVPTAEEEIEKVDLDAIEKEQAKAVLIDYDEQSALDNEEREQFRAKADISSESLDNLPETSISPIKQISSEQMESIRRAAKEEKERALNSGLTVDDLLSIVDSDLEDLNS